MSNHAAETNQTWPFVTVSLYESLGANIRRISGTEITTVFPVVARNNSKAWLKYAHEKHGEQVRESHMLKYNSLDNLKEVGYTPYFQRASPSGFIEDIDREVFHPMWQFSPPMFFYKVINWNVASVPDLAPVIEAVKVLRDEILISRVRPYVAASMSFTTEEHTRMHSDVEGSSTEYPHSFIFTPIRLDPKDPTSPVVAEIAAAMAWDFSLRNLLPDGVIGIHAVIKNTCNQSFTYEIRGTFHCLHIPPYGDLNS